MNLVFGKYISKDTFMHRFDGRLKIISFLIFLSMIFVWQSFLFYFLYLFFFLTIFFIAKIPFNNLKTILKAVLLMMIFLLLFNLISLGSNKSSIDNEQTFFGLSDSIFEWKFISLRWSGIFQSFYYVLRFFLVVLLTVILISTTSPDALTFSIESLLSPLLFFRFPVHIFSTIISLTLRLVPTLFEEASNIMKAQASRGLDFENGNIRTKIRALIALLIPLIVSIFYRAEEMALSMESRGYNPHSPRTKFRRFYLRKMDWLLFGVALLCLIIFIFYMDSYYEQFGLIHEFDELLKAH